MVRRFLSLLLAVILLGVTGQRASFAAREPNPMQSTHMMMSMADCMKMMEQATPEKAGNASGHKGCTPADCLNHMIACSGIVAALPEDPVSSLVAYDRHAMQRPGLTRAMRGRSLIPEIQPPIA
jgi:hypothetical protein